MFFTYLQIYGRENFYCSQSNYKSLRDVYSNYLNVVIILLKHDTQPKKKTTHNYHVKNNVEYIICIVYY